MQIKDAINAACGNVDEQSEKLAVMMRQLSEDTEFEKANTVKKQLDQLERLKAPCYKWTCDLADWRVLHIDKSAKIKVEGKRKKEQTYTAFVISNGYIRQLEPFTLDGVQEVSKSLARLFGEQERPGDVKAKDELMSLVSLSLYRSKPAGIWINCSKGDFPDRNQIADTICERFSIEL